MIEFHSQESFNWMETLRFSIESITSYALPLTPWPIFKEDLPNEGW